MACCIAGARFRIPAFDLSNQPRRLLIHLTSRVACQGQVGQLDSRCVELRVKRRKGGIAAFEIHPPLASERRAFPVGNSDVGPAIGRRREANVRKRSKCDRTAWASSI